MDVAWKVAAVVVVVGGGSLATLGLAIGGHLPMAWLALAGTAVLALATIALLARGQRTGRRGAE